MSTTAEPRHIKSINEYFEDLQIGDRVRSGRGRTITEADLVMFSAFSGDWASLHTDQDWVEKHGPFPGRIAHGCLTLSAATGLEFSMLPEQDKIIAFYGMDRVRFVKPVFIGDTIHLEGEIIGLDDKDDKRGVLTLQQEIKNQKGETCVALQKRLLLKKRAYDA
jgi:acyl dehydratase